MVKGIYVIMVALAAAAWAVPELHQWSDETMEIDMGGAVGDAALCEFKMPSYCGCVTGLRYYATTSGSWKAVLYNDDAYRLLIASRPFDIPAAGWRETDFYAPYPSDRTFYVGVEWVTTSTPRLGVDTQTPYHGGYNWNRQANGIWNHPIESHDRGLGVYVDTTSGLGITSLGRVKAMYR